MDPWDLLSMMVSSPYVIFPPGVIAFDAWGRMVVRNAVCRALRRSMFIWLKPLLWLRSVKVMSVKYFIVVSEVEFEMINCAKKYIM